MDWRTEARDFLQSRRARLSPHEVGLVGASTRRRVPGLRREEVAMLAGISVDYYARLEKGHLETASTAVLDSIARALRLDSAERSHMYALARAARGEDGREEARQQNDPVRPSLIWMLEAMSRCPAYVRNGRLDVLASNALARVLYKPLFNGAGGTPNLATFCFLDDRAHEFFPAWLEVAQGMMELLRAELGRNSSDQHLNRLLDLLVSRSDAFRTLWASQNVRHVPAGTTRIQHPTVGVLSLAVEALNLAPHGGLTMVAYAAEPDSDSEKALTRLLKSTSRRGGIAVGS